MSGRVVDTRHLVPADTRQAVRWALVIAPAGAVIGLAAGWLYGHRKTARC